MGLEEQLRHRVEDALDALVRSGELDADVARRASFTVEPPRKGGSGHVATNVALALAKAAGKKPRELAEAIAVHLRGADAVHAVEIAGPGFLNVSMNSNIFHSIFREVVEAGPGYGRVPAATGERINVEFVSANPTGPLLISHGRGAVVGDSVARLLEATGHRVTREYYVNDFGNQVRLFARSVLAAHRGEPPPEGGYGGDYVGSVARWLGEHRLAALEAAEDDSNPEALAHLARLAVQLMLDGIPQSSERGIRDTLARLGIEFDVWSSEDGLHRWGRVAMTLDQLEGKGRLKDEDGAKFFVTGDEDEKDRVVRKRDGHFTYFASDIAYHDDKIRRGFDRLIDVWGHDHHGYVARTRAALDALDHDADRFEILLFQLVSLLRDGKPYKMGKRLGNLITIQEVQDEIDEALGSANAGRDALRFYYLSRKVDTPVELDVDLAKKQENENPVFYIQYGHARLCSILRTAEERCGLQVPRPTADVMARVDHPHELELIAWLGRYPAVVSEAAQSREPSKVVHYLRQLAQTFQSYYTQRYTDGDPILPPKDQVTDGWKERWDVDKTLGRLLWVDAIRGVYASGLGLLGVTAPERMERPATGEGEPDEPGG